MEFESMRRLALSVFAGTLLTGSASASPVEQASTRGASLETIVVTGEQPGPGLWKVSKDEHVMWVLGTLSPLPKRLEWRTAEVARRIGESKEVLMAPQVKMEANVGFFGRLALLPSLIGIRDNPNGARLADMLPADLYERWRALKQRYIGRSNKVEQWRPIFAARELYESAIGSAGLAEKPVVTDAVRKAAKKAGVPLTPVLLEVGIDAPKAALKDFKKAELDDQECFRRTLDRVETDLVRMTERANAWSTGDLAALRALPQVDAMGPCRDAIMKLSIVRERGLADLEARLRSAWVDAATTALARDATSFAVLPMHLVVDADGYLAELRRRGYAIEAPDAEGTAAASH
jgi:hypothetical protein